MKKILISLSIFVLMVVGSYTEAAWYNGGTGYNYNYIGSEGSSYLSPSIRVISPNNGGESVEVGGKIEIRWQSNVSTNLMVDVYVSNGINKGSTVRALNNGALGIIYTLDNNLPLGSNYRACVSLSAEPSVVDCSDLPFTIKSSNYLYNSCPLNMPNPLSMCPNSTMVPDRYDSNGCVISYKCSNYVVDNGCPSGAIFSSTTGQRCPDSIKGTPLIKVLSPNNGGESLEVGGRIEIRWDTNVVGAAVDVYVSDGVHKGATVRGTNGSLIYVLDSNLTPGSNYRAYVSLSPSGYSLSDYSDYPFTIKSALISVDNGCLYGARYSTTTGKLCSNVINDNKIYRTLRWGDIGEDVKILQRYLGLYPDGVYGRGTVTKVKTWQRLNNVYPDGVFGSVSRVKAGL